MAPHRLAIRVYGSALGRLQAPGVASIVTSADEHASAEREIDWAGDRNVFAGWRGFFARGEPPTITVDGLAQARSTWNATEEGSQKIFLGGWTLASDPARESPARLVEKFLSGGVSQLTPPADPGPGLFPKTIDLYPGPPIPEPAAWALATPAAAAGAAVPKSGKISNYDPRQTRSGNRGLIAPANTSVPAAIAALPPTW